MRDYARGGFTLVELLIYVTIVGAVASSLVLFSVQQMQARSKQYVEGEVQANLRVAMGLIGQRIRDARDVNVAGSSWDSDPGMLELVMDGLTPTRFFLDVDDGQLLMSEGGGTPVAVTSNAVKVTRLVFRNLGAGSGRENVGVELRVEFDNPSGDVNYAFSDSVETAVSLRKG